MTIINLAWRTIIVIVCSFIQAIGALIEGIARILLKTAQMIERGHNRIMNCGAPKKKVKKVHIDVAL